MDQFFFQILYCWFILQQFWTSLIKPTTLSRDFLFWSIMGMPGMLDHAQEKLHDQIVVSMDILLHTSSKLSASNSFWDIRTKKIVHLIGQEYFKLQLKN